MTTIIYVDVPISEVDAGTLTSFLSENQEIIEPETTLRMSLHKKATGQRQSKYEAAKILKALLPGRTPIWRKDEYSFDFNLGSYMWGNTALHLTSQEQLVLYQKLVLDVMPPAYHAVITNVRRRLGPDFLVGYI